MSQYYLSVVQHQPRTKYIITYLATISAAVAKSWGLFAANCTIRGLSP